MTIVQSFGNLAKRYPIRYLQQSDTFQVQLSDQIHVFGDEQISNLYALRGSQPIEGTTKTPSTQQNVPQGYVTSHVQTIEENAKIVTPKEIA